MLLPASAAARSAPKHIMDLKWFNLPGAKDAYIQGVKLGWVDVANLDIPWINFYTKSPGSWDFFALSFPDQAWALKQIQLIDRSIDEVLVRLGHVVNDENKAAPYPEETVAEGVTGDGVFDHFLDPTSMQRQQHLILHYLNLASGFSDGDDYMSNRERGAFMSTLKDLVDAACVSYRAKLLKQLLSSNNTAALLSVQTKTDASIWGVRRQLVRRNLMLQNAMRELRGHLGYYYEEDDDDDDDEMKNNEEGEMKNNEEDEMKNNEEDEMKNNEEDEMKNDDLDHCGCETCSPRRSSTPKVYITALGTVAVETGCELPLRGYSVEKKDSHEMDGDWTSVKDDNESNDC